MLGWMLSRGQGGARGGPDDTQLDLPDTPAPVFAARAFKAAIFGTPARSENGRIEPVADMLPPKDAGMAVAGGSGGAKSPSKPPGILLTPGTATSRRKRVSFGNDVEDNAGKTASKSGLPDELPGKFPSPWTASDGKGTQGRPRTRLTEALENSRKQARKSAPAKEEPQPKASEDDEEGAWEEVEELDQDPDITVDLNEPHSRSGKYWKSEFKRYQEEAKVEMEKLLKYKQLAKSYAQMKDAEAVDLHEKLKEEKEKVAKMEGRISELAGQISRKRMKGTDRDNQAMIRDLTRQTALAVQYRNQVKELEAILENPQQYEHELEPEELGLRGSPRVQKTLHETQRELRRAREQVRELDQVKSELRRLKTSLRSAEQRELKVEVENKRLASELSNTKTKVQDLEQRLKSSENEARRKDEDLRELQRRYDTLKEDAKARVGEAEQVLRRKNEQISDLRKKARASKGSGSDDAESHEAAGSAPISGVLEDRTSRQRGLAELQDRLKAADREQRERSREELRNRFEELSSKPDDNKEPGHFDILEDDSTLPPILAARLRRTAAASGTTRAAPSESRAIEKRRSSGVLAERSNRDDAAAPTAAHQGTSTYASRHFTRHHSHDFLGEAGEGRRLTTSSREEDADKGANLPSRRRGTLTERSAATNHARPPSSDSEGAGVDLLEGKFARLGGGLGGSGGGLPDVDSSTALWNTTSRSTLPADRRAAALARLEHKKAERKRGAGSGRLNKENVRPSRR